MSSKEVQPASVASYRTLGKDDPSFVAAQARAEELIRQAKFNEAVVVIDLLTTEVTNMELASRFSKTRKPSESLHTEVIDSIAPRFMDLTEVEYKRAQLLENLKRIRAKIVHAVGELQFIVLDIEATKRDF